MPKSKSKPSEDYIFEPDPELVPEPVDVIPEVVETPPEEIPQVSEVSSEKELTDNSPDVYPNEVLGIPTPPEVADEFKNMPDDWKERNKISVEERAGYVAPEPLITPGFAEPMTMPVQPDRLSTDVPLVEASALREPSPYIAKVGLPVLFGGEYAAIITKVWHNGLVNLIVFSSEHPVSDIKTKVPYGIGRAHV